MRWRELHWARPLDPAAVAGFLRALAADPGRGSIVFEARAEAGNTRFLLAGEGTDLTSTASLLRQLIPGTVITDLSAPRATVERAGRVGIRQRNLNLALDSTSETLRAVLGALASARGTGDVLVLQIVLGRALAPELVPQGAADPTTGLSELLLTGPRPIPSTVRSRMQDKLSQYRFRAMIRIGVATPSPVRRRLLVHSLLAALRTLQSSGTQITLTTKNPERVDAAVIPLRQPLRLTPDELLPLLGWPLGDADLPGLPGRHPQLLAPPAGYAAPEKRVFGTTTAPGIHIPIGISDQDALRHTHIYGPTGAGKSNLLLHLIAADVEADRSVVVIDPKRDLATDTLALIPERRTRDVALIDPSLKRPAGMNPFAGFDRPGAEERRPLVADIMLDLFRGLFPNAFGPLTADTLHASLLTLTYAPGATLAALPRLLTEPKYRREVVAKVADPVLQGFWAQYDAKSPGQQAAAIGPVATRLRQFLLRSGVRAVVDQPSPAFRPEELFSKRRILIVSLNKGLLGAQTASLLGSLVVAQLWQLILAQAALPATKRRPISIYIDEAQHFLHLGDLAEALEQSRALGVAWHLAHQHRSQMPDKLLKAIDANARNKIVFGLEDDEARTAARLTGLDLEDFTRLPPYEIYASLQSHGRRTGWFSGRVLPPPKAISSPDAVAAEAEARYGSQPTPMTSLTATTVTQHGRTRANATDDEPIGRSKRSPQ